MEIQALGLIETKGYLGAVRAADAAIKAAHVNLIGVDRTRGGLVTVKLTGDVGAVRAAVDAGSSEAESANVLFSSHVIARVHEETEKVLQDSVPLLSQPRREMTSQYQEEGSNFWTSVSSVEQKESLEADERVAFGTGVNQLTGVTDRQQIVPKREALSALQREDSADFPVNILNLKKGESLTSLKVEELRKLARRLYKDRETHQLIKFGKKIELVELIEKYQRKGDEE